MAWTIFEMMFENFKKTIQQLGKFADDQVSFITDHLRAAIIAKDEYLLKEGKVCQSFYFINRGSFRHYEITETGDETTLNLLVENDWVLDYKSFTSQKPSTSFIQAAEESEVLELSVYNLHKLMKTSDCFFQLGKIFQYAIAQPKTNPQKTCPKEKYTELLSNKPQLIQRFPLKYIASYLDITPETLSRVRKSLA